MNKIYSFLILLASFYGKAQTINIPDANFKAALLNGNITYGVGGSQIYLDTNEDGEIQVEETLFVNSISIEGVDSPANIINSIEGVEKFTNLKHLAMSGQNIATINLVGLNNMENIFCIHSQLTSINLNGLQNLKSITVIGNKISNIDFSTNPLLEYVNVRSNKLVSLDISNLNHLIQLNCSYNLLTSLDLNSQTQLTHLDCSKNNISSLNITGLLNLEKFEANENQMTSLDFTGHSKLEDIKCTKNNLNTITLSGCSALKELFCYENNLVTLNISENPALKLLLTDHNSLEYVNLKNGSALSGFSIRNNPALGFVCVDENENPENISDIHQKYPNCVVSTNCSLSTPDFNLEKYISLYPNPTTSIINLEINGEVMIESLEVYNIMGQMVLTMPKANNTSAIDVASLASGTYILKVTTNKGTSNSKFIKK